MAASSQRPVINSIELCGKLTTHDPDTYIVLCLHCLHYFRSLTDLHRHRLLNHNILDSTPLGESLPRVSKDGSWLVAGGDLEPQNLVEPTPRSLSPGMHNPSLGMSIPSPPHIQVPQFSSLGPHRQMQTSQYHGYSQIPPHKGSSQSAHSLFPHGQHHPQSHSFPPQIMSNQRSPIPSPQSRSQSISQSTTFSPAAREFVPSGMTFNQPFAESPSPSQLQPGYHLQQRSERGEYGR